jgi:MtN3 and saliva related transmembrane protein
MQMAAVFEIIGTTGALIICASAIPQVVKTYRIKRSRDLSIVYLSVLMLGMGLLQSYSVYVRDFVFIFGNTLSMLSTGLLIVLWFRFREQGGKDKSKRTISHRPTQTHTDPPSPSYGAASKNISLTEPAESTENLLTLSPVYPIAPYGLRTVSPGEMGQTHPCGRPNTMPSAGCHCALKRLLGGTNSRGNDHRRFKD